MNDLVVIGASAGGIEALSVLMNTLPASFPAPIVIAQHLDPTRPSSLSSILQRHASLTLEVVTSSSLMEAGKVYVVPSNRHVVITDGHVALQEDRGSRPRPSIDLLISSAARIYGDRLIAVILTGSGSDGAAGVVEVKQAGGIVIAQNPVTARYPSMPLALPPTAVDFEMDVERIGPLLVDILNGTELPQIGEKADDILGDILEQVSHQANIDFRPYKNTTLLRRISRRMLSVHIGTMSDYARYLETHPAEIGELVSAFLINVTEFFRDPDAFAYLRSDVLPALIARARETTRVLRFWSAGCATGEEAYSLAMLITDLLGAEISEWSIKIFATDLDVAAITYARRGVYAENLLSGVPNDYRERFFERIDDGYRILKTLRQMVIFGQQDLSRSAAFPRIDMVLCRNILIYFTLDLQEYVLNQFAFSLSPGGVLFLGKAETVRPTQLYFEPLSKLWKIYRCTGNALPSQRNLTLATSSRADVRLTRYTDQAGAATNDDARLSVGELAALRRFNELLLRALPVGLAVIDRSYRLISANAAIRRTLGLHEVSEEQDFLHAARGLPYDQVRAAIDSVFHDRKNVTLPEIELSTFAGGWGRFIALTVTPIQAEAETPDLAAITVSDVTEHVQLRQTLETMQSEQAQLTAELSATNKQLNDTNKELLDANEELQISNEELVLTHEELQATIEEFETTNEELQATNEELETNNEELQATNEELETTNDEIGARTAEQVELTHLVKQEQGRLSEIIELSPFYILVLRGPDLRVQAFNPRYTQISGERQIIGQPISQVAEVFWGQGTAVIDLARQAYIRDMSITSLQMLSSVTDPHGTVSEAYFTYRIVPLHDAANLVSGVIIYATDVTEQRDQDISAERERLRLIFEQLDGVLQALFDARSGQLLIAPVSYLDETARQLGCLPGQVLGAAWREVAFFIPPDQREVIWQNVSTTKQAYHLPEVHYTFGDAESETIWNWSLTPIENASNPDTVQYVLMSALDVTEQVRAREAVEQLDRLKDEFLSVISHEMRSPLTTIAGNVQLLQRSLEQRQSEPSALAGRPKSDAKRETRQFAVITNQVYKINLLIDDMLDLTRIQLGQFEPRQQRDVDLVAVIRRIIDQQAAITPTHPLSFQTTLTSLIGTFDETRIEQVLNNLIGNAFKYSDSGKPVTVSLERRTGDTGSDEALIAVRDEGYGIPAEQQPNVFQRFYRVRSAETSAIKGTGLGLYISREIVIRFGGEMWFESTLGVGSTFYVALPIQPKGAP